MKELPEVTVITDGSCSGNPGPGGYAAILTCRGAEKVVTGGHMHTTNNRMEVMAVVEALRSMTKPCIVKIVTDSKYVITCAEKILKESLVPYSNADVWRLFYEAAQNENIVTIEFTWVRGHNGHPQNERADALAKNACEQYKQAVAKAA